MKYSVILQGMAALLWLGGLAASAHGQTVYYPCPSHGYPPAYQREYAPAVPAPPSSTAPPAVPARPQVIESRSLYRAANFAPNGGPQNRPPSSRVEYETYDVASTRESPANGNADKRCSISFWNLSNRPLVLQASGRRYTLAEGQHVALSLHRVFNWSVGTMDPVTTEVPEGGQALEVVFRNAKDKEVTMGDKFSP